MDPKRDMEMKTPGQQSSETEKVDVGLHTVRYHWDGRSVAERFVR